MLNYNKGIGEYKNWILCEEAFFPNYLGKCESIMCLGNGYLGLRSAFEEPYVGQTRNLLIAGTYNKCDSSEVTELPNVADVTEMQIYLNSQCFSLNTGKILEYSRYLNLKDAELVRAVLWESPNGERYKLTFKRFVSLDDLHLISLKVSIIPINCDAVIKIKTGIDGKVTNSGSQHFIDGEKRVFDKEFIQLVQTTTESNIDFVLNCYCNCFGGNLVKKEFLLDRRSLYGVYEFEAKSNIGVTFEKIANVFTSRDKEYTSNYSLQNIKEQSLVHIKNTYSLGYDNLFERSKQKWVSYWEDSEINLVSSNDLDVLALRFAQYHLLLMTPSHDERFSIGAKALTGEGYKGHVFWDTEIFILPYFQYNMPQIAKQLLKYRYLTLQGARNKAAKFGYKGAMYPWETAFTGEEETPEWAAINIMTGKPTRVWSGVKEHHITADIAYAVWQYYLSTDDLDFMKECGYEIIFECAWFWCSRVEWNSESTMYEIKDVIGPDEYTEHIDNNAYTNYMAYYIINIAVKLYELIKNDEGLFKTLDEKLNLNNRYNTYCSVLENLYIPRMNEKGIISQDDTFLSKNEIDISKYRDNNLKQSILLDYTREQIIGLQVLKQADVVMLLYTLKDVFDLPTIEANWKYYEARTIHDSSLSMAIHSIVATFFGDTETAYNYYRNAYLIDMGENPISSNSGIHSASQGGVWMAVVFGFCGVFNNEGNLEINPVLPKEWSQLSCGLWWKGKKIHLEITKSRICITSEDSTEIELKVYGNSYLLKDKLEISFESEND